MSYEKLLENACSLIEDHNSKVKQVFGEELQISIDLFKSSLLLMGATTEERLSSLSHENILDCLILKSKDPDPCNLYKNTKPLLLAKDIAKIFRNKTETENKNETKKEEVPYISDKKVKLMTRKSLIENYDVKDLDLTNPISKRLKEISKNKAFIVFQNDGRVNVDASLKLLEEIVLSYPERQFYTEHGEVYNVYKVGEGFELFADENPIYSGRPLRPDGTCDQTGRSYDGVPLEVRKLLKICVMDRYSNSCNIEQAHQLIDIAISNDAFDKLKYMYPTSYLKYQDYLKNNKLPNLKISLKDKKSSNLLSNGRKVGV